MTPLVNRRIAIALFSSILMVTWGYAATSRSPAAPHHSGTAPITRQVQSSVEAPIVPFKIHVSDAVLLDLKQRLANPRFPDQIEGSAWEYGPDVAYMKELVSYWREKYDWRTQEQQLNRFDHFKTKIDGLDIHFIHQRSKNPNARPLILLHGWGGSFYELTKVIDPLTDPVQHGGRPEDAFHVVVPSIPGYGFSDHPRERGWESDRTARAMMTLMARLGYNARYAVHGGDIGSGIGRAMAINDAAHVIGLHLNSCGGGRNLVQVPEHLVFVEDKQSQVPTLDPRYEGVPPAEVERTEARWEAYKDDWTHVQANRTKAQTIGYGANDSPVGLAGWAMAQYQRYCDCVGDPEKKYTKDELLTWIMMYWLPEAHASAARWYREGRRPGGAVNARVEVPTALACFPKDVVYGPRQWAESRYNLQRWTEMPRGGHFSSWEEPELTVADIRDFFRDLK